MLNLKDEDIFVAKIDRINRSGEGIVEIVSGTIAVGPSQEIKKNIILGPIEKEHVGKIVKGKIKSIKGDKITALCLSEEILSRSNIRWAYKEFVSFENKHSIIVEVDRISNSGNLILQDYRLPHQVVVKSKKIRDIDQFESNQMVRLNLSEPSLEYLNSPRGDIIDSVEKLSDDEIIDEMRNCLGLSNISEFNGDNGIKIIEDGEEVEDQQKRSEYVEMSCNLDQKKEDIEPSFSGTNENETELSAITTASKKIEEWVQLLQSGGGQERENAAVNIAKKAETDPDAVKAAIPALKDAVTTNKPKNLHWKAASALAEIAKKDPTNIQEIEPRLIEILNTKGRSGKYNATLALVAIESTKGATEIRENLSGKHGRAVAELAYNSIIPVYSVKVDYSASKLLVATSVDKLVYLISNGGLSTPEQDCLALTLLLKEYSDQVGDYLVEVAKKEPQVFNIILPALKDILESKDPKDVEYGLWALREYAKHDPEEITDFVDTVGQFITPPNTLDNPGNAIGVLSEVVDIVPKEVLPYKDYIEDLQAHKKRYVREDSENILDRLQFVGVGQDIEYDDANDSDDKAKSNDDSNNARQQQSEIETTVNAAHSVDSDENSTKLDVLKRKAKSEATSQVSQTESTSGNTTPSYSRSQAIVDYVKARADGHCEGCDKPAPFISKTGNPYLHAHHVYELSEGGSDRPETVIALCPNCHYRVHHGEDGDVYNDKLVNLLTEKEEI